MVAGYTLISVPIKKPSTRLQDSDNTWSQILTDILTPLIHQAHGCWIYNTLIFVPIKKSSTRLQDSDNTWLYTWHLVANHLRYFDSINIPST